MRGGEDTELFKLLGMIAIDNEQANHAIDETAEKADEAEQKTSDAFSKIGGAALKIGTAVLTAGAALGGAWIAAIEGTREYRAEMAKLDTAFTTNGHSSQVAKQTYSELNAVLGDSEQAVEASQHLAKLTDDEKELQTWTGICTGVYATFGASLPIEGLTEAANETAKTGILTGGLTDALNWAGISEEEFQKKLDACSGEQERQKLIMDTLNDTYSKASEKYKETNKDVMEARKAQERLNDAFAELGRIGEPILTAIKNKVADMATAAIPHIQNFIQKVKDLKKWIKENENTVDTWVAVIIGATVSIGAFLLMLKWSAIMGAATKAVKAVRAAIILFNAALRANPIGLVVSLLVGLVAAFIYLWNNNKGFRDFWLKMWDKIKSVTSSAVSWVKGKFNDFKGVVSNVRSRFEEIRKGIADKIESARAAVKKAIDKIKGFFKFSWSLPKIKVPSFTIKGKFSLDPPSIPKIGIKWNAEGGILTRPTIFGAMGDTLLGGGEAGAEAILPIDKMKTYVREAVRAENESIGRVITQQNAILMDFLRRTIPHDITLDGRALVGELTPVIDGELADRWAHIQRGNTR
jgi:phage-related protein